MIRAGADGTVGSLDLSHGQYYAYPYACGQAACNSKGEDDSLQSTVVKEAGKKHLEADSTEIAAGLLSELPTIYFAATSCGNQLM